MKVVQLHSYIELKMSEEKDTTVYVKLPKWEKERLEKLIKTNQKNFREILKIYDDTFPNYATTGEVHIVSVFQRELKRLRKLLQLQGVCWRCGTEENVNHVHHYEKDSPHTKGYENEVVVSTCSKCGLYWTDADS